jgi:hypothetical protein
MATKPSTLPVWSTDTNYTNGPKVGTPTKVDPGLGKMEEGWLPSEPPPAQYQNYWQNLTYQWCDWVNEGKSSFDVDKHIVETDIDGVARANTAEFESSTQLITLYVENSSPGMAIASAYISRGPDAVGGNVAVFDTGANNTGGPDINVLIDCSQSHTPQGLVVYGSQLDACEVVKVYSNGVQGRGIDIEASGGGSTARGIKVTTTGATKGIEIDSDGGTGTSLLISGPNADARTVQINLTHSVASGVYVSQPVGYTGYSIELPCAANGKGLYINPDDSTGIKVDGQGNGNGVEIANVGSGEGIIIANTGTGNALEITQSGTQGCVYITGTSNFSEALKIDLSSNTNQVNGILVYTAQDTGSRGISVYGTTDALYGIEVTKTGGDIDFVAGTFTAGGSASSTGILANGGNNGRAASFTAENNYVLRLNPTNSPDYAPLYLLGQTTDPSTETAGTIFYNSADDRLKYCGSDAGLKNQAVWGSTGGNLFIGDQDTGIALLVINNTSFVDLATLTLTGIQAPFVSGVKVKFSVTVSFYVPSAADSNILKTRVYDNTSTTVASGTAYMPSTPNAKEATVSFTGYYDIPATGNRTFKLQVAQDTNAGSDDITITQYSFIIEGYYD